MLALLLRHTLFTGDVRSLVLAVHASYAVAMTTLPFDCVEAMGAVSVNATAPIDVPVLTHTQREALLVAPVLRPEQLRAAQAMALALLGTGARAQDAKLMRVAEAQPAFAPDSTVKLFDYNPGVLAVLRSAGSGQRVMCLANATGVEQLVPVLWRQVLGSANVRDFIGGARLAVHGPSFALGPYDVRWLV
jgi:hypothetical protein